MPYEEVVKGYEVSSGRYVVLENDEVKAAAGDRGKVVHIEEFVDAADIDPVFYEKTYFVGSARRRRTPIGCCTRRFTEVAGRASAASAFTTASTSSRFARSTI